MTMIAFSVKQSNGLCRIARTFHVRAAQQVEHARLMDEFYGAAFPTLREAPFPKGLSPFGPAPDVNVRAIVTKPLARLFPCGKIKTCL